jgi:aminoglycoside phosphotransferase (APT) family kinase protein
LTDPTNRVRRIGETVHRPTAFWSPAVHGLLSYLELADFPAPRVLAVEDDTEVLSWIDGDSGPTAWAKVVPENGLRAWAAFLRRYHDTVERYRPPSNSVWSDSTGGCASGEIVCHGDFGPWNSVWRGNEVVGLIDWDHAGPRPPSSDLFYALEYAVPFRSDEECVQWLHYPSPPDRRRRIEVFCEAYGMEAPTDVVDQVIGQQQSVLGRFERLARRGVEPQATWVRQGYAETLRARISWSKSLKL